MSVVTIWCFSNHRANPIIRINPNPVQTAQYWSHARSWNVYGCQLLVRSVLLDIAWNNSWCCFPTGSWPIYSTNVKWKFRLLKWIGFGQMQWLVGRHMLLKIHVGVYQSDFMEIQHSSLQNIATRRWCVSSSTSRSFARKLFAIADSLYGAATTACCTKIGPPMLYYVGLFGAWMLCMMVSTRHVVQATVLYLLVNANVQDNLWQMPITSSRWWNWEVIGNSTSSYGITIVPGKVAWIWVYVTGVQQWLRALMMAYCIGIMMTILHGPNKTLTQWILSPEDCLILTFVPRSFCFITLFAFLDGSFQDVGS